MFAMIDRQKQMGWTLVLSNLLSEPLATLYYSFLVFALYKDMGASAGQVALLTMLKPVVAVLSFYWSAWGGGLRRNVLWAGFWMRAPFLLCPWVESPWYMIGAAAGYMFFYRGGMPAWLEMVRRNMSEGRNWAFSMSSALGYVEGVVLALACGALLDRDPSLWKGMFFVAALLGMAAVAVQSRVAVEEVVGERPRLRELVAQPWRDSWRLMRERPDFGRFQWGFMVSGFGLMLIQPALPVFMVDVLGVSYLEMAGAISIAKGLGFALSSPLWARGMDRVNVFRLASWVFGLVGLFMVLLSFSVWSVAWLFVAYFCYGVGQGGSHLVWHMSGLIFAGKEESSRYTGVNVALVGVRGAVAPPIGSWLTGVWGPVGVLVVGCVLCFYSGIRMIQSKFAKDSLSIKV
jgi:MFS family permease